MSLCAISAQALMINVAFRSFIIQRVVLAAGVILHALQIESTLLDENQLMLVRDCTRYLSFDQL